MSFQDFIAYHNTKVIMRIMAAAIKTDATVSTTVCMMNLIPQIVIL